MLREEKIKFVREKGTGSQNTYLIDLEPMSPLITKMQQVASLVEINEMPEEFKYKLLVDREPVNNEPRDRNENGKREKREDRGGREKNYLRDRE